MSLFLLGAGFDADAGRMRTPNGAECVYPLVADTARLCFGLEPSQIPAGKSIEDLFLEAEERHDAAPMEKLTDKLMEADYYLASRLASEGESNCYSVFFRAFDQANFLTFNYDSLPEIFLYRMGLWFPDDGYGVPVQTQLDFGAKPAADIKSTCQVLHLHGSFCLRSSEFEISTAAGSSALAWLRRLEKPLFKFDPDCISHLFIPYRRVGPDHGYTATRERVIAPVPNKGPELEQAFVRAIYEKAQSLVRDSGLLIALGYSFNYHDRGSYTPILSALGQTRERKLIVVSPQAAEIAARIRTEHPNLDVHEVVKTLRLWAANSFAY